MAHPVLMPKQGITVESCVITTWHKKLGESVQKGEALYSYETDKATFDVEAEADGVLLAVFYPEGEDIPVLTAVAAIGEPGEDVSAIDPRSAEPEPVAQIVQAEPVKQAPVEQAAPVQAMPVQAAPVQVTPVLPVLSTYTPPAREDGENIRISPRARALAASVGLIPNRLTGTGPDGRILERDVRTRLAQGPIDTQEASAAQEMPVTQTPQIAQAAPAIQGEYRDEKLSGVRRAIAKGMMLSLSSMAQLTLSTSFDATAMLALRKAFKASSDPQIQGITLTDMVLFATVRALSMPEHQAFNAHLIEDTLRLFAPVHLAFAADTPRGLLVPVIRNAHSLSLRGLSQEVKRLAAQAQAGNISPDDLTGGTFTVSNLGGLGIEHFTPVINPPQTGILGVNNITYRPLDETGDKLYPAMGLSITFDHRAIDGAPAARFVGEIGRLLANMQALLAG